MGTKLGRVGICVPSTGQVLTKFMHYLIDMLNCCDVPFYFYSCEGCLIPKNRQQMVQWARDDGCSHVLFLDADMKFPPDLLDILLYRDCDVIAANCTSRKHPVKFLAEDEGAQVITDSDSVGIQQVNRVGTGIMLIRVDVFDCIAEPWFIIGYNPETGNYTGEDYWFCEKCREAGIPIWIDHDVSRHVAHIGQYPYNWEDKYDYRKN